MIKVGVIGTGVMGAGHARFINQNIPSAQVIGISVDVIKNNQDNSGGGQYIIKNTDWKMWEKIYMDCAPLYDQMLDYQRRFPINPGQIQFWTAEMWSILWNTWWWGIETRLTKELDFCWATDNIDCCSYNPILHMAGVTDDKKDTLFFKGEYIKDNPIKLLQRDINCFDYVENNSTTFKYINEMKKIIQK